MIRPRVPTKTHLVTDIVTALLQTDGILGTTSVRRGCSEKPSRKVTLFGIARFGRGRIDSVMVSLYSSPDLILITPIAGCWHGVAWFTRTTGLSETHCAETGQVQIVKDRSLDEVF